MQRLHAVSPDQRLSELLPLMAEGDVNKLSVVYTVVYNAHLAGMLCRAAVLRVLTVCDA